MAAYRSKKKRQDGGCLFFPPSFSSANQRAPCASLVFNAASAQPRFRTRPWEGSSYWMSAISHRSWLVKPKMTSCSRDILQRMSWTYMSVYYSQFLFHVLRISQKQKMHRKAMMKKKDKYFGFDWGWRFLWIWLRISLDLQTFQTLESFLHNPNNTHM